MPKPHRTINWSCFTDHEYRLQTAFERRYKELCDIFDAHHDFGDYARAVRNLDRILILIEMFYNPTLDHNCPEEGPHSSWSKARSLTGVDDIERRFVAEAMF